MRSLACRRLPRVRRRDIFFRVQSRLWSCYRPVVSLYSLFVLICEKSLLWLALSLMSRDEIRFIRFSYCAISICTITNLQLPMHKLTFGRVWNLSRCPYASLFLQGTLSVEIWRPNPFDIVRSEHPRFLSRSSQPTFWLSDISSCNEMTSN